MKTDLTILRKQIAEFVMDESAKAHLLAELKNVEKDLIRSDFKLKRTLNDKAIAVNLLNQSIEDLQKHQSELSQKNQEIELKNEQLEAQNLLVAEQTKKLEENLRQLELSYQELEQFSYIASHDLKSPLRNIASYSQLLNRRYKGKLDEQADEFLNFIVTGAKHMDEIIRDLLEYSKSGKEKNFVKTNFNKTLDLVKFNLQKDISESGAKIISNELPELIVNKTSILQLFQNLIGNAIKFRNEESPVISINSYPENGHWCFTVKDNGVGMDEVYQKKAFQPFQRINNLDRPGTGMGLAICKKVVKMHNGDIWFQSKRGEGTTFHFTIFGK